jgi:hypothetical protein
VASISAYFYLGLADGRATAVGVYRLWRDTGFAVGAPLAGLVVVGRMYETHRPAPQP